MINTATITVVPCDCVNQSMNYKSRNITTSHAYTYATSSIKIYMYTFQYFGIHDFCMPRIFLDIHVWYYACSTLKCICNMTILPNTYSVLHTNEFTNAFVRYHMNI